MTMLADRDQGSSRRRRARPSWDLISRCSELAWPVLTLSLGYLDEVVYACIPHDRDTCFTGRDISTGETLTQ